MVSPQRPGDDYLARTKMEQRPTHKFLRDRAILLGTVIDDETARDVADALEMLNAQGAEPITLYVNSPGGSVTAGWSILEAMNASKAAIDTVCLRRAGGLATLIFASGAQRFGLADCVVSFDEFSGGAAGESSSLEHWRERLIQRVASKLKMSQETLSTWISENRTFSGEELRDAGMMELV